MVAMMLTGMLAVADIIMTMTVIGKGVEEMIMTVECALLRLLVLGMIEIIMTTEAAEGTMMAAAIAAIATIIM